MYQYLCLCMNMHVCTCTSCHAFIPNQIFPFPCFLGFLLRQWETWLSFSATYMLICSGCKGAPRVLPFFLCLIRSTLLPQTPHAPLPHCMRHPLPTLPPSCPCCTPTTKYPSLPLPTHLLRRCYLPRCKEQEGGKWREGRSLCLFPLMDGFETLPNVYHKHTCICV